MDDRIRIVRRGLEDCDNLGDWDCEDLDPRTAAEVMETALQWEDMGAVCINFEDAAGPGASQVFTGEALWQQTFDAR